MIELKDALSGQALDLLHIYCKSVIDSGPAHQIIDRKGSPYIHRWVLGRKILVPEIIVPFHHPEEAAAVSNIPSALENIYIHKYLRPDADTPHCHPWPNVSIPIHGWFKEDSYEKSTIFSTAIRKPGDVVIRNSEECHAITDVWPGTISLFITAPKDRDCGFWKDNKFIPWQEYTYED